MKKIGITQREEVISSIYEPRDALDQRWMDLFSACEIEPLLIPNHLPTVKQYLSSGYLEGVILSGGNDVGSTSKRDAVEKELLDWVKKEKYPLLGVCRGMQMLHVFFGGTLTPIVSHVNTSHLIHFSEGSRRVNSFHHFGIHHVPDKFIPLAKCSDGTIESMKHINHPWYGIMWHPERELSFINYDLDLIRGIFR